MMTIRRVLISLTLIVAATLSTTAQVARHEIKVGDFNRLTLVDNVNVVYRCMADSAGMAVVSCTPEELQGLMFSLNSSNRLSLQVEDRLEKRGNLPTVTLYSSSLEEAENDGDSTLRITHLPPLKSFKARMIDNGKIIVHNVKASKLELQILSGKGKIIASGTCDDLVVKLVGTGEIQADNVQATNVVCRIMGTGRIGCNVLGGQLKVSGSGTGKVYYKGTPSKVTVRKLGTIKAIPME